MLAVRAHVAALEANRPDLGAPTAIVVGRGRPPRGGDARRRFAARWSTCRRRSCRPGAVTSPERVDRARARRPTWPRARCSPRPASRAPAAGRSPRSCRPACGRSCCRPARRPARSGRATRSTCSRPTARTPGAPTPRPSPRGSRCCEVVDGGPPVARGRERRTRRPADRGARRPAHRRAAGARGEPRAALDRDRRRRGADHRHVQRRRDDGRAFSRRTDRARSAGPVPRCRYRATAAPRPGDGPVARAGSPCAGARCCRSCSSCSW